MLDKLGAANRTEAVTRARELDLIPSLPNVGQQVAAQPASAEPAMEPANS